MIFFKTIVIDFIVTLSKSKNDFVLTNICKIFKRVNIIFEMTTWTIEQWTNAFLDRLLIANWKISKSIISNKNFKFISKFWTTIFKRFETILLLSTTYHSQTNGQSERINQTIKITFRYFVTKFSKNDWIETLSLIQNQFNNSSNANIELTSNEICYEFKTKDVFTTITFEKIKKKSIDKKKLKETLNKTRFKIRQKATNAISFANVEVKLIYDKRHKSLMLRSKNKVFFIFNKGYRLFEKLNKKLSQ